MTRTTIIPESDHVRTPWRNGGGTTVELARSDDGPDGFDWRLSIADITSDGGFSQFPGYRRMISTVEGAGMRLDVDGRTSGDLALFVPFSFDGANETECTLLDGPIRDFNLIYRADRVSARLQWVRPDSGMRLVSPAATLLVFNAGAELTVGIDTGHAGPETPPTLGHFDMLRVESGRPPVTLDLSGTQDAVCCLVELDSGSDALV